MHCESDSIFIIRVRNVVGGGGGVKEWNVWMELLVTRVMPHLR